ncbi:MAG TPA: HemK2/MTQ2 family protein methyltransferase [Chloroflexota bacterium]|nr:HemK2/MTQ2 family protein methyltransferase [Chloroflexota bacterium]
MDARADRLALRRLSRPLIAGWFHLFARRRHRRLVLEDVCRTPLAVLPDVFNPALFRSSELLTECVLSSLSPGTRLLDMGTGSGVTAVAAARQGASVVAVDISPAACRCARINTLLNGVECRVDVRQGDLFEPVGSEKFDIITFNPPFFPGTPSAPWEVAWRSDDVIARFLSGVQERLAPEGRVLVVLSSDARDAWLEVRDAALDFSVVARRTYLNEVMSVIELRRAA